MGSKESHNSGEPASDLHIPSFFGSLEDEESIVARIARQNNASEQLGKTIFPKLLTRMAKDPHFRLEYILYDNVWSDMNPDSAALDLFWDLKPTGVEKTGEVRFDTYNAKALSIEMLPNGNLIVRGDNDYGTTVLLPKEWKNRSVQKKAFDKAFANPKLTSYAAEINMPLGRA